MTRTYTCIGCNEPKTTDKPKGPIPHRCPEYKRKFGIARASAAYALKKKLRSEQPFQIRYHAEP